MVHPSSDAGQLPGIESPRVSQLLARVAAKQTSAADRIAGRMLASYDQIPTYAGITDPALQDDIQSVSAAVVRGWLQVMSTGEPPPAEFMAPLVQGARRRATQGVDLPSLLRAYRIGIRVMWAELMSAPEWQNPVLQPAMAQVAEWALDFAERCSTEVAAGYLDEMAHVTREREHRRSALLDTVLAGPGSDPTTSPPELRGAHAVVVARVGGEPSLQELEDAGMVLESTVDAALWTVRRLDVIAVVKYQPGMDRPALLGRLEPGPADGIVAVGLGGDALGARDTRQSYNEATSALRLGAALAAPGRRVHDYQELAPVIALMANPDQAHRFVATALGPLGALADKPWVPATLEAFVTCQGRGKLTAAQLGVHVNTVKYRIGELRQTLGQVLSDGERCATLVTALKLRQLLAQRSAASLAGGTHER